MISLLFFNAPQHKQKKISTYRTEDVTALVILINATLDASHEANTYLFHHKKRVIKMFASKHFVHTSKGHCVDCLMFNKILTNFIFFKFLKYRIQVYPIRNRYIWETLVWISGEYLTYINLLIRYHSCIYFRFESTRNVSSGQAEYSHLFLWLYFIKINGGETLIRQRKDKYPNI